MLQTITVLVKGKVQGVFYRQTAKEKAKENGITGYVENLPGGDVYIIATGTKEQLDEFVTWCRQGPSKAIVTEIRVEQIVLQEFEKFTIRRH
jgi:acylphosphatase